VGVGYETAAPENSCPPKTSCAA